MAASDDFSIAGSFTELMKLSRNSDDIVEVFRAVLEHLTRITACRRPRLVWYPRYCPLFDKRPVGSPGKDAELSYLELPGAGDGNEARSPVFSLPLHHRGQLYGRLEIFGLEPPHKLGEHDFQACGGFVELLTGIINDKLSQLDTLTGLYSQDELERRFGEAAERFGRYGVVMLDLDHFKSVNDTYGHAVGDRALRSAAAVLRRSAGDGDFAVRRGGEEMVLILVDADLAKSARIAEKVRRELAAETVPVPEKGISFRVTASLGVGLYPEDGADGAAVLHAADKAVYAAKNAGRNRVYLAGRTPRPLRRPEPAKPRRRRTEPRSGAAAPATLSAEADVELTLVDNPPPPRRIERRHAPQRPPRPNEETVGDREELQLLRRRLAGLTTLRAWDLSAKPSLGLQRLHPYYVDEHRGDLYIIEYNQNRVHRLPLRTYLETLKRESASRRRAPLICFGDHRGEGALSGPSAVAVDDDGGVWIADTHNSTIKQYDPDGSYLYNSRGKIGDAPGSLNRPQDVVHHGGFLLVADTLNHRLQGWGPSGRWDLEIGVRPARGAALAQPTRLAVGPDGRLYVIDLSANRIIIYSFAGDYLGELDVYGNGPGQLRTPTDLTVTREGVLVVAEGGDNNRLQFFDATRPVRRGAGSDNLYGGNPAAAAPALEHLGTIDLRAVRRRGERLELVAPSHLGEPDVETLRPWSVAGSSVEELYLVDQNSNHLLGLQPFAD